RIVPDALATPRQSRGRALRWGAADARDRARPHAQPQRPAARRAVRRTRAEAGDRRGRGPTVAAWDGPRDPARGAEPRARHTGWAASLRDEQGDDRVPRHA